jgi:undecaprenol kinase
MCSQKGVSSLPYIKPDKKNVFRNILQNVNDSNNGLKIMFKESGTVQRLIPIEIMGGVLLGIGFGFNALEYIILAVVLVVLFTVETINTAIEEVYDLVTLEENPRVKRSKDIASGSAWVWHLVYVICAVSFIVMHLMNFAWWKAIIPG